MSGPLAEERLEAAVRAQRRAWLVLLLVLAVAGAVLLALLARWTWAELPTVTVADPVVADWSNDGPERVVVAEPALWRLRLWQPLRDPPPVPVAPPPPQPLRVTLFAITDRDGVARVTFDDPDEGLFHLRPGESARGLTLVGVADGTVTVRWQGEERQLEFGGE